MKSPFSEKTTIILVEVKIKPALRRDFINWQTKLNSKIVGESGFLSLEILSQQEGWKIVERFTDAESANKWRQSEIQSELMKELEIFSENGVNVESKKESSLEGGVTEVFVTEVHPGNEAAFREWIAKIYLAEAQFPGFRGTYVQSPLQGKGKNWITLLQFDHPLNLDRWLTSPERQAVLKESEFLVKALESHRVISPYAGWFASITKEGELPPAWKQTMIVLFALFPIVMLQFKFLKPWTQQLDVSLGTFIGNAISVSLISWPMMPFAIWLLGWWLKPKSTNKIKTTLLGVGAMLLLYFIEIVLFWSFI